MHRRHQLPPMASPPRVHSVFDQPAPPLPAHSGPYRTPAIVAQMGGNSAAVLQSALLAPVPRNAAAARRRSVPNGNSNSTKRRTGSHSAPPRHQAPRSHSRNPPRVFSDAEADALIAAAAAGDTPPPHSAASPASEQQVRRVRFGNNNNNNEGGEDADAAAAPDANDGSSRALTTTTAAAAPHFDPEVAIVVKRRLGQENSNRIRLARQATQLDQELALARKEHAKLQARANAIPSYEGQLAELRVETDALRDDLENLDVEFGMLQQRYRDVDAKVEPVVQAAARNKRRLETTVRESREQQMANNAAALLKKERALQAEIVRLEEQRQSDLQALQRAVEISNGGSPSSANKRSSGGDDDGADVIPSPARVRDAALHAALAKTREDHALHRGQELANLHAAHRQEMQQLAEEELARQAKETHRVGSYTNQVNSMEIEATVKKHEVDELAARKAQATARLAELGADIAIEQQRLQQSAAALAPAKEEMDAVQARLDSAKEHLDRAAVQARMSRDDAEKAAAAAAAAWVVEQADLARTAAQLEQTVAAQREREKALQAEVEKRRKQREAAAARRKEEVLALVRRHEERLQNCKRQAEKFAADARAANEAAERLEQEAQQIESRLNASQKSDIISQLHRQHSEINSTLEGLLRSNAKLEEKLKTVLTRLGDDAAMI